MRVDAHLHLWDPALDVYDWITPELGPLNRAFTAGEAQQVLADHGIDAAVLVQAADSTKDTDAMLLAAAAHPWVAGVVGWLDLEDDRGAEETLDRWGEDPVLCGARQLVHDDPRPDLLEQPAVLRTLRTLAARGLTFDVPDAFPRHLGHTAMIAEQVPELVVVVDHLGKPPRNDAGSMATWERQLRAVAAHANTVAKVSGLGLGDAAYSPDALRPAWDVALEAFGPQRLMLGSDWPVSLLHADYGVTTGVLDALVGELSGAEQESLRWRTAARTYSLSVPANTSTPIPRM